MRIHEFVTARYADRYTASMWNEPSNADCAADWQQVIPRVQDDLDLLQRAAYELANTRTIDPELRSDATAAAHRLLNPLETFGHVEAAVHVREAIATLKHAGLPQPERLEWQVNALAASLASALDG